MAVKRRVGFRIDPSREPGRWKRAGNREPKMVSELRGRSARVLSPRRERPLQRPAVSSGRRKPLPQHRGRAREGAVNQGGTTEVLCAFVLVGSCPPRTEALFSCFRLHKAQKNVLRSAKKMMEQQERENIMSKISRRDFLKVTGIAAAAAALTACGGSWFHRGHPRFFRCRLFRGGQEAG